MNRTRYLLAVGAVQAFLAVLLLILNVGCGPQGGTGAPREAANATVVVERAERRAAPLVADLEARVEAVATVEVRANVEGQLTGMSFKEGLKVKLGQLLFRIDPRKYDAAVMSGQAAVNKAEADVEMAREAHHLATANSTLRAAAARLLETNQDVERLRPLAARRAVPQRDLDAAVAAQASAVAAVEDAKSMLQAAAVSDRTGLQQARAGLMAAKAGLDRAELERDETEIHAPMAGLIGRAEVAVGNYVGRGEPTRLAIISQLDPIKVVFNLPQELYLRTVNRVDRKALERIELILADKSRYPFLGKFTSIERAVDAKTGEISLEARFPNPRGILLPGMSGRVKLEVESKREAVLVAATAVMEQPGAEAVYVVTAENKVELRSVVAEGSYEGKSVITQGLNGGESVIVEGMARVRPGQVVATRTVVARQDR